MKTRNTRFAHLLIAVATVMAAIAVHAQTTTTTVTEPLGSLAPDPWVSARAAGMSGALAPLADGLDAVYYNPAGIGGLHNQNEAKKLRLLTFPWVGATASKNALLLQRDVQKNGASDPGLTSAILDSYQGKRQYGRLSVVPAFNYSRLFLGYTYDNQLETSPIGDGTSQLYAHYRKTTGPMLGFSALDPAGRLYMGITLAQLERKEVFGDFTFDELSSNSRRNAAFQRNSNTYSAAVINSGIIWMPTKRANTKVALVSHNLGKAIYANSDTKQASVVEDADLSLALAVSPQFGRGNFLNMCLQGDNLTAKHNTLHEGLRAGMEYTFGSAYGVNSLFGIRAGYSGAGPSAGASLHVGILSMETAASNVNVVIDDKNTAELRYSAIFEANIVN